MGILSSSLPVPPLTTSLASLLNDSQLEYISGYVFTEIKPCVRVTSFNMVYYLDWEVPAF